MVDVVLSDMCLRTAGGGATTGIVFFADVRRGIVESLYSCQIGPHRLCRATGDPIPVSGPFEISCRTYDLRAILVLLGIAFKVESEELVELICDEGRLVHVLRQCHVSDGSRQAPKCRSRDKPPKVVGTEITENDITHAFHRHELAEVTAVDGARSDTGEEENGDTVDSALGRFDSLGVVAVGNNGAKRDLAGEASEQLLGFVFCKVC